MIEINYNDCNLIPDIFSVDEAVYRIYSNKLEEYNIDKIYYTHRKEFLWEIIVKLNSAYGYFSDYKDSIFSFNNKKFNIIPFIFFYDNYENDHHSNFQILIIEKLLNNKYNISMITVDNIFVINKTLYINKENKSIIKIPGLPDDFEICDAGLDLSLVKNLSNYNFIKIDKIISHIFEVEIKTIDDKNLFLDIQNNQDINSYLKKIPTNWNPLEELLLYFYCYNGLDFFEKNIEEIEVLEDDNDFCHISREYFKNLIKYETTLKLFTLSFNKIKLDEEYKTVPKNMVEKQEEVNKKSCIWL